jgi:integrase/recombinase XerD
MHTWRYTFASYLMMRSGNIRAIQKLLGHKSIKTTEIYAHLSDRHLYQVISLLSSPNLGISEHLRVVGGSGMDGGGRYRI